MAYPYPPACEAIPELVATYERQVDELAGYFKGLSGEQLRARPVAGRWSCMELLCHLVDSDLVLVERMKRAIAMERPLVIEYDEVSFAARLGYQQRDVSEELELMRGARRQMTRILRGLAPADWERQAVHSETGIKTTKQFAQMAVGHVIHHLSFLVEKRKALGVG